MMVEDCRGGSQTRLYRDDTKSFTAAMNPARGDYT